MKLYIRSDEESNNEPAEGNVGIWWLDNNKIQVKCCSLDISFNDSDIMRFNNNYDVPKNTIKGTVFYDARCQYYGITGASKIADKDIIYKIAESFNINDLRYEVVD